MNYPEKLEAEVSKWPGVSAHSHRFGGREFVFGKAEIGHVHNSGIVDIPFPRAIRDALIAEGAAEEHHWVPNSGWITFRMEREQDVARAQRLLRLSYLRYALRHDSDPIGLLERESARLQLSAVVKKLLEAVAAPRLAQPAV